MGALARFSYREIIRKLKQRGFEFDRNAKGSHEIWWNPITRMRVTIPNHQGNMAEGTLRAILKQIDLSVDDFLELRLFTHEGLIYPRTRYWGVALRQARVLAQAIIICRTHAISILVIRFIGNFWEFVQKERKCFYAQLTTHR